MAAIDGDSARSQIMSRTKSMSLVPRAFANMNFMVCAPATEKSSADGPRAFNFREHRPAGVPESWSPPARLNRVLEEIFGLLQVPAAAGI
jgi:hypothetical protein